MKSRLFQKPKGTTTNHYPKTRRFNKSQSFRNKKKRKKKRIIQKEGSSKNRNPTTNLGVATRQEQMSAILFFRIPMPHSFLQPLLHELPYGRRLHLLNQQIPASHHVLHLTTEKEHLAN
ncbi:BnaA09g54230D [Brassica napus]|uniref:BnaA09g54230D protein n=1 Tax=Brassica napus TaxID=3708 RepID=A0A078J9P5_BRANA|nr:BnaA09g54230D [Brassica napus]